MTPNDRAEAQETQPESGAQGLFDPIALRDALPSEMLAAKRWLLWKLIVTDDDEKKVPYYADGTVRKVLLMFPKTARSSSVSRTRVRHAPRSSAESDSRLATAGRASTWMMLATPQLAN